MCSTTNAKEKCKGMKLKFNRIVSIILVENSETKLVLPKNVSYEIIGIRRIVDE